MIIKLYSLEEIKEYREVGRQTAIIFNKIIDNATIGVTGIELDELAREECNKINAKPAFLNYKGFPAAICVSKNKVMVHGIPDDIPFNYDDIVSIDFGLEINGFIGDMAATIDISMERNLKTYEILNSEYLNINGQLVRPLWHSQNTDFNWPSWGNRLLSTCSYSLEMAIKSIRVGDKLSTIGAIIHKIAKEDAFKVPAQYGGHGIERFKLHSPPFIPNYDDENNLTLRAGMVLAIEPMFIDATTNNLQIMDDGWAVVAEGITSHFEHTIAITEDGAIILTKDYED